MAENKWYVASSIIATDPNSLHKIPDPGDYTDLNDGDKCLIRADRFQLTFWKYDASSTATPNDINIITPEGNPGPGRWILEVEANRLYNGHVDVGGLGPISLNGTSEILFEESTRTFTIRPAGADPVRFYVQGKPFEFTTPQSIVIPDVTDTLWIYFDENGDLQFESDDTADDDVLILRYALVAFVTWNATDQRLVLLGDERHGQGMSNVTHLYNHQTTGARFSNGFEIRDLVTDGNGDLDNSIEFSVQNGAFADEDIPHIIADGDTKKSKLSLPAFIPVIYRLGTGDQYKVLNKLDVPEWQASQAYALNDFVVATSGQPTAQSRGAIFKCTVAGTSGATEPTWNLPASGLGATTVDNTVTWTWIGSINSVTINDNLATSTYRVFWNENVGGTWQLTEATNNDFVNYHIFCSNGINGTAVFAVVGQAEYNTIGQARTGAEVEIRNLFLSGIPTKEFIAVATLITQSADGYGNHSRARFRSTDLGFDYIDWRTGGRLAPGTSSGVSNNHNDLSNIQGGQALEYFHLTSDEYTNLRTWFLRSTSFTAVSSERYLVDTGTAAVTATLPASPSQGDKIEIVDSAVNFGANNCTLARNGNNINGLAVDYILDINKADVRLVYVDSTTGWRVIDG